MKTFIQSLINGSGRKFFYHDEEAAYTENMSRSKLWQFKITAVRYHI